MAWGTGDGTDSLYVVEGTRSCQRGQGGLVSRSSELPKYN